MLHEVNAYLSLFGQESMYGLKYCAKMLDILRKADMPDDVNQSNIRRNLIAKIERLTMFYCIEQVKVYIYTYITHYVHISKESSITP